MSSDAFKEIALKTLDEYLKESGEKEKLSVYLATVEAFEKYCRDCGFLVKADETGSWPFSKRVFCKAEKCAR